MYGMPQMGGYGGGMGGYGGGMPQMGGYGGGMGMDPYSQTTLYQPLLGQMSMYNMPSVATALGMGPTSSYNTANDILRFLGMPSVGGNQFMGTGLPSLYYGSQSLAYLPTSPFGGGYGGGMGGGYYG